MTLGFAGAEGSGDWRAMAPGWVPLLAVVAVFSMLLGNLAALVQNHVKRLLAYSAIAHGGYALLSVVAHNPQGVSALVYYVVTYGLTTLGAFAIVSMLSGRDERRSRLVSYRGLFSEHPLLAGALTLFLLSLAGVPPLSVLVTAFGLLEVFAYGLAMSRSAMLAVQLAKKSERQHWRQFAAATAIEVAIVFMVLLTGSVIEGQEIA